MGFDFLLVQPQVRYSTREFYHNAIDHHIIPKLGGVKLEKLTMLQIQRFYNELLKERMKTLRTEIEELASNLFLRICFSPLSANTPVPRS